MVYGRTRSKSMLLLVALMTMLAALPASSHSGAKPTVGGVTVESNRSFEVTWEAVLNALESNQNITVIDTVDHAAAAASVGLALEPNRVVFFGNPNLGTPVMQAGQTAGIDLPQKIHVYVSDGTVYVAYNAAELLADRHDAGSAPTLDTIAGALATLSSVGADAEVDDRTPGTERYRNNSGLVTVRSEFSVDETWDRLLAAIGSSPANILFALDHQANAARVGLDLGPTRVVVFGNPNLGTPLMQTAPSTGIDLPLKMLVWEDADGDVFLTYNSTDYLGKRHFIKGQRDLLSTIGEALANFAQIATSD